MTNPQNPPRDETWASDMAVEIFTALVFEGDEMVDDDEKEDAIFWVTSKLIAAEKKGREEGYRVGYEKGFRDGAGGG